MSQTFAKPSGIQKWVPRSTSASDAYRVPIYYGPHIREEDEWTMTVLVEPGSGKFSHASIYNNDYCRGSFYQKAVNKWQLTMFDYPPGAPDCGPEIIRYAALKIQEILGPNAAVFFSTAKSGEPIHD